MTNCPDVPAPTSLKEALDFAGALNKNSSDLKDRVGKELQERVKTKLSLSGELKSVSGSSISDNFEDFLSELDALRKEIVDTQHQNNYGNYEFLKDIGVNDYCAKTCVSHILDILPSLYATLNFLYFQVDSLQNNLGGGGWENQSCNTGSMSQWLKDSHGLPSASHSGSMPSDASPTILPGGYGNNLSAKQGSDLDTPLGELISGAGGGSGRPIHNLLLDLVLITRWSTCNTATCMAAVRAVCENIAKKFQTQIRSYSDIRSACSAVQSHITTLTPDQDDSNALLTALFEGAPHAYSETLEPDAFRGYMMWLTRTLPSLIASLTLLKTDSTKWAKQDLTDATISGSFGYGFSFGGKWRSNWNNSIVKKDIPEAINKLTTDLTKLQSILQKHFPTTEPNGSGSSAGSIAGSLLGTAAVGGAGAAVALNVGGVSTALKGVIGILK
ncbi:secreted antigen 1 [Babesia caballi]|uniref:Secreted antigen 1 n=1 Tax=Babesia caballi TaxID=5871 RepID=A0AAV4M1Y7_BABCB|nr:secreted antigen 1 [Babesia caballi]